MVTMPPAFLLTAKCGSSSLCAFITGAYRGTGDNTLHILNLGSGCGCDEVSRFDYWKPRVGCRSSLWQLQRSLLYCETVSDGQWQRTLNVSFSFRISAIHRQPTKYLGRGRQCWGCQLLHYVAKLYMWQLVQLHLLYLLWLPEFSFAASICYAERYWRNCLRSPTHIKTTRLVTKLDSFLSDLLYILFLGLRKELILKRNVKMTPVYVKEWLWQYESFLPVLLTEYSTLKFSKGSLFESDQKNKCCIMIMQVYRQDFVGKAVVATPFPQRVLSTWRQQITALATRDHLWYVHVPDVPKHFEYRLTLKHFNTLVAVELHCPFPITSLRLTHKLEGLHKVRN